MSVTIVNDYRLMVDGDKKEAMAAAAELVRDFNSNQPGVQLSLWLEDQGEPLHHFHITVFDDQTAMEQVRGFRGYQAICGTLLSPHGSVDPSCTDLRCLAAGRARGKEGFV